MSDKVKITSLNASPQQVIRWIDSTIKTGNNLSECMRAVMALRHEIVHTVEERQAYMKTVMLACGKGETGKKRYDSLRRIAHYGAECNSLTIPKGSMVYSTGEGRRSAACEFPLTLPAVVKADASADIAPEAGKETAPDNTGAESGTSKPAAPLRATVASIAADTVAACGGSIKVASVVKALLPELTDKELTALARQIGKLLAPVEDKPAATDTVETAATA